MKQSKLFFLITFLVLIFTANIFSQNLERFLKYDGVSTIASLAHPTSSYQNGYYTIYSDYVLIDIYYADNYRTKVKLHYSNGFFTGVTVVYDNDWFPPFGGIELMKNVLLEVMEDADNNKGKQLQASYEKWLNKKLYQFTGKDMTILILTINWFGYQ